MAAPAGCQVAPVAANARGAHRRAAGRARGGGAAREAGRTPRLYHLLCAALREPGPDRRLFYPALRVQPRALAAALGANSIDSAAWLGRPLGGDPSDDALEPRH